MLIGIYKHIIDHLSSFIKILYMQLLTTETAVIAVFTALSFYRCYIQDWCYIIVYCLYYCRTIIYEQIETKSSYKT